MKRILILCAVFLVMGCARMSLHEEMYRAGKIPLSQWQAWEQQEQDFRDGKGRFPFGSQGESDLLDRMLAEPVRVRIR